MPPASAVPILSILGTSGSNGLTVSPLQTGMTGNGLFLGFLSQIGLNTGNIGIENTHPQFGRATFNTDPAMLVLPPGVTTLSGSDLKAYLAAQAKESGLSDNILAALTAGTPQVTNPDDVSSESIPLIPIDIVKNLAWGYDDPLPANLDLDESSDCFATEHELEIFNTAHANKLFEDGETDLSFYTPDNNAEHQEDSSLLSNPLLIATGLTPAQIEDFQQQLIAQSSIESENKEATDAAGMTMVLVNFAPPAPDDRTSPSDIHMIEIGDATSKHNMLRPLHPFEVQKLAENMNDTGTKENSGYIASFARHNGFTNGVANNHATTAAQSQGTNAATGSMDDVSKFFLSASSSFDTYGLLSPLSAQNSLAPNNTASAPILYNSNATGTHPATQMVAATLSKAAGSTDKEQKLSLELDPPELGRVQIHLSYEKGEPLKVRVLTEKQETLTLLQRDAHALKSALDDAGIKADGSSLSFDMAGGDQSFNQMLGQFHDHHGNHESSKLNLADAQVDEMGSDMAVTIETHLADVPNFGGNGQGYSFLA